MGSRPGIATARKRRRLRPVTPISVIKNVLRRLSMYSRERRANRKAECEWCGELLKSKLESHHRRQPNWELIISVIRRELLPAEPEAWETLCSACHEAEHATRGGRQFKRKRTTDDGTATG